MAREGREGLERVDQTLVPVDLEVLAHQLEAQPTGEAAGAVTEPRRIGRLALVAEGVEHGEREIVEAAQTITHDIVEVARDEWRPGDQRVFYADFRKVKRELGWEPKIDLEEGMELLFDWIKNNKHLF